MGIFSALYGIGLTVDRFAKTRIRKPRRLPYPVVSIGNLTVGGTGKTPAVMAMSRQALSRGFMPVILTRGYRGSRGGTSFVSTGSGPLLSPDEAGDEPYLMAHSLEGAVIVKGADRFEAGVFALDNLQDLRQSGKRVLFIVDDGYQHWGLRRDLNALLIDAVNPFGNRRLLPEGPLREPLSAMIRADVIVISKSDLADTVTITRTLKTISETAPDIPVFRSSHRPVELIDKKGEALPAAKLRGRRVFCFSGIANPVYFQALIRSLGAEIVDFMGFRDHHRYTKTDMDEIRRRAMGLDIITTEKDMVKTGGVESPDNLTALRIEFTIDEAFYEKIFRRIG